MNLIDFIDEDCKFSVAFKNLTTKEEINMNENVKIPSASVIKIYIMGEAMRQVIKGKISLDSRIIVDDDVKVDYSILTMLQSGNSYTILDLITLMIVQSDNTATNILIDILSMDSINDFIRSLGLKNTILKRKMMDFDARKMGMENYTSAYDAAKYLEMIYNHEIINDKYSELMIKIMKWQLDKSKMMLYMEDEIIAAHKTGELNLINHDVGIVYLPGCPYIFSMMTWDAKNNLAGRLKIGNISKSIYDYLNRRECNENKGFGF